MPDFQSLQRNFCSSKFSFTQNRVCQQTCRLLCPSSGEVTAKSRRQIQYRLLNPNQLVVLETLDSKSKTSTGKHWTVCNQDADSVMSTMHKFDHSLPCEIIEQFCVPVICMSGELAQEPLQDFTLRESLSLQIIYALTSNPIIYTSKVCTLQVQFKCVVYQSCYENYLN
jgi:hypothetical protein